MVEPNQLFQGQRRHGIRAASIVAKLNLGYKGGEQLNDGSDLAAHQAVFGQVPKHRDL